MTLDYAFICDFADTSGSKVHALGIGFDTIHVHSVPFRQPGFYFVAQIRYTIVEVGMKQVRLTIVDADGRTVAELGGNLALEKPPWGSENSWRFSTAFLNVVFPAFGSYSIHFGVDGHQLAQVPLRVVSLTARG